MRSFIPSGPCSSPFSLIPFGELLSLSSSWGSQLQTWGATSEEGRVGATAAWVFGRTQVFCGVPDLEDLVDSWRRHMGRQTACAVGKASAGVRGPQRASTDPCAVFGIRACGQTCLPHKSLDSSPHWAVPFVEDTNGTRRRPGPGHLFLKRFLRASTVGTR